MDNEKWRSEFIRFLKEHNAYSGFVKNFKNETETRNRICWCSESKVIFPTAPNCSFKDYFDKCTRKENLLSYAFTWRNTEEGERFWYDLSDEWSLKVNIF